MDLNLLGIILSAVAIIINVVLARFGFLRLQLLWEVGYTPIAMFLSVWPLYTLGVIGPDAAIVLLAVSVLPMAYFMSIGAFRMYIPLLIGLWAGMCAFVLRDEIGEFFLSTVFPFVGAMASVALVVIVVIGLIYLVAVFAAFIGEWINNISSRRH